MPGHSIKLQTPRSKILKSSIIALGQGDHGRSLDVAPASFWCHLLLQFQNFNHGAKRTWKTLPSGACYFCLLSMAKANTHRCVVMVSSLTSTRNAHHIAALFTTVFRLAPPGIASLRRNSGSAGTGPPKPAPAV